MRNLHPFLSPASNHPRLHHHTYCVSRFKFYHCCESEKIGSRNNISSLRCRAVERDSEFEFDPDKARDALRILDQQLDRISQKQANPLPKVKASSPYNTGEQVTEDVQDTGSFLPFAFFGLLIFTIVYNIVFIQIIKPSIDGPQVELSPVRPSLMKQLLKDE